MSDEEEMMITLSQMQDLFTTNRKNGNAKGKRRARSKVPGETETGGTGTSSCASIVAHNDLQVKLYLLALHYAHEKCRGSQRHNWKEYSQNRIIMARLLAIGESPGATLSPARCGSMVTNEFTWPMVKASSSGSAEEENNRWMSAEVRHNMVLEGYNPGFRMVLRHDLALDALIAGVEEVDKNFTVLIESDTKIASFSGEITLEDVTGISADDLRRVDEVGRSLMLRDFTAIIKALWRNGIIPISAKSCLERGMLEWLQGGARKSDCPLRGEIENFKKPNQLPPGRRFARAMQTGELGGDQGKLPSGRSSGFPMHETAMGARRDGREERAMVKETKQTLDEGDTHDKIHELARETLFHKVDVDKRSWLARMREMKVELEQQIAKDELELERKQENSMKKVARRLSYSHQTPVQTSNNGSVNGSLGRGIQESPIRFLESDEEVDQERTNPKDSPFASYAAGSRNNQVVEEENRNCVEVLTESIPDGLSVRARALTLTSKLRRVKAFEAKVDKRRPPSTSTPANANDTQHAEGNSEHGQDTLPPILSMRMRRDVARAAASKASKKRHDKKIPGSTAFDSDNDDGGISRYMSGGPGPEKRQRGDMDCSGSNPKRTRDDAMSDDESTETVTYEVEQPFKNLPSEVRLGSPEGETLEELYTSRLNDQQFIDVDCLRKMAEGTNPLQDDEPVNHQPSGDEIRKVIARKLGVTADYVKGGDNGTTLGGTLSEEEFYHIQKAVFRLVECHVEAVDEDEEPENGQPVNLVVYRDFENDPWKAIGEHVPAEYEERREPCDLVQGMFAPGEYLKILISECDLENYATFVPVTIA